MRASEAEREVAVAELREHAGDGRLDLTELEQRVEIALAARTRDELDELLRDLPTPVPSEFDEHLRVFIAVQLGLIAIWALSGFGYFWPIWPFMGWGIGLVVHGACDPGTHRLWARESKKGLRRRATAS